MMQEAFVDSVAQDQTAWNVQSSLIYTVNIFIPDYMEIISLSFNGSIILDNEKLLFIHSVVKELTEDKLVDSANH